MMFALIAVVKNGSFQIFAVNADSQIEERYFMRNLYEEGVRARVFKF